MFKLVTMALLLILAYGIGLVMLELKNAPLMDDEILSSSFGTGASMNFTSATPPFSINPRWVKKITYRTK